jgi:hypothetical protein
VLVVGALAAVGHPRPHNDELFFIAPAIQLVEHGALANPAFREWSPLLVDKYYFQTPFYSYLLIGWFQLWGVSQASLAVLYWMIQGFGMIALYQTLRRFELSQPLCLLATTYVLVSNPLSGYRPDGLATALFAVVLWLLVSVRWSYPGYLLYSLICVLEPYQVGWLPVVVGLVAYRAARRGAIARELLVAVAAALTGGALFYATVHGHVARFVTEFMAHAHMTGAAGANPFASSRLFAEHLPDFFLAGNNRLRVPEYLLAVGLAVAAVARRRCLTPAARFVCGTMIATFALSMVLSPWKVLGRMDLIVVFWNMVLAASLLSRTGLTRCAAVGVLTVVSTAPVAVALLPTLAQHSVARAELDHLRTALADARQRYPRRQVVADIYGARYLVNYQLPAGWLNWEYSCPQGELMPVPGDPQRKRLARLSPDRSDCQKRYIWVLGITNAAEAGVPLDYHRPQIFGRTLKSGSYWYNEAIVVFDDAGQLQIKRAASN